MIWLNIKKLEQQISDHALSDEDGLKYLIASSIVMAIAVCFTNNNISVWLNLFECIVTIAITVWGIKTVFQINKTIDGQDFFKRFIAISWVIGVRIFLLCIVLMVVMLTIYITVLMVNAIDLDEFALVEAIFLSFFSLIFQIVFYLLVINSFRNLKPKSQ